VKIKFLAKRIPEYMRNNPNILKRLLTYAVLIIRSGRTKSALNSTGTLNNKKKVVINKIIPNSVKNSLPVILVVAASIIVIMVPVSFIIAIFLYLSLYVLPRTNFTIKNNVKPNHIAPIRKTNSKGVPMAVK